MRTLSIYTKNILLLILVAGLSFLTGCSDDDSLDPEKGNGMLQFRLYKQVELSTKSTNAPLNKLYDAKKIRVVLNDEDNNTIIQTLKLESFDEENAEYGLTSEKLELLEGTYELIGYYLYNAKDEEIKSDEPDNSEKIVVLSGGLTKQSIYVDALAYGKTRFYLIKDFIMQTKATSDEPSFPFRLIKEVDITIKNVQTQSETIFNNLPVTYLEGFEGEEAGTPLSAVGRVDSLIVLEAGTYAVTKYVISNKGGITVYDTNTAPSENEFVVENNLVQEAEVPVRIAKAAAHIQDYMALRAIWEALDGENWSFSGDNYPRGTNWDFNKDIDMWGEQPGVSMNSSGRVIGLTIGGFGPSGVVPDEIGLLSELSTLILGEINDMNGNFSPSIKANNSKSYYSDSQDSDSRLNDLYFQNYVKTNSLAHFSEISQRAIAISKNVPFSLADITIPNLTPKIGTLTNHITAISDEIKNLSKLTSFSIANSPIAEIPDVLDQLPTLTDVQVANCPNLKSFPDVLTRLDAIVAINIAMNPQISDEEMRRGLDKMAVYEGQKATKTIQLLYLSYNNLTTLPASFSSLERLAGIECTHNKLEVLPALGAKVSPVLLYFSYNKIHTIQTDGEGVFCNMDDVDEFMLSDNELTQFPDIFDAKSIFQISTIDLSYNNIQNIKNTKGVNTEVLVLAGNELTEFPSALFDNGSYITFLNLSNNKISSFPDDPFIGKYAYAMTTLDLTYNHLKSIPSDFNNLKLPYLTGLDLSYNRLSAFPYRPLNIASLTIYGVRYQRDVDGYRCLKEWPLSIYQHKGLRAIWLGGNDFGRVPETEIIGPYLNMLDISDNPNLILDVSSMCSRIADRTFQLNYDPTQNIIGCSNLDLE